jgi:hypothetical protein
LESFEQTSNSSFLESALAWHEFLEERIGFRPKGGVNYWAHDSGESGGVSNNSALVLRTLSRFAQVTGDESFLQRAPALLAWLASVQSETGEFPYVVAEDGTVTQHFWCFNYNSFEFLDLHRYYLATKDSDVLPILERLAEFLSTGVSAAGACRYECNTDSPIVLYYTPALALALREATQLGLGDYSGHADRAASWLMERQRANGSFAYYSSGNYGLLVDRRSYPRYLAMILNHLISGAAGFWQTSEST